MTAVDACAIADASLNERYAQLRASGAAAFGGGRGRPKPLTIRKSATDHVVHFSGKVREPARRLKELCGRRKIEVPRGGFFQVNPRVASALVDWLVSEFKSSPTATLLDPGPNFVARASTASRGGSKV